MRTPKKFFKGLTAFALILALTGGYSVYAAEGPGAESPAAGSSGTEISAEDTEAVIPAEESEEPGAEAPAAESAEPTDAPAEEPGVEAPAAEDTEPENVPAEETGAADVTAGEAGEAAGTADAPAGETGTEDVTAGDAGEAEPAAEASGTVYLAAAQEPALSFKNTAGDEKIFRVTLSGRDLPDGTYKAAVWSADKGQDDLKWITMTRVQSAAAVSYRANIRIADFRSAGNYHVHVYRSEAPKSVFVTAGDFTVSAVCCGSIVPEEPDPKRGTCRVRIEGADCPSGITRVQVPVWCSKDQSDIRWYDAQLSDDGSWYADIDIANHKYHTGNYKIHTYGTSGNGFRDFMGSTGVTIETDQPTVTAREAAGAFELSVDAVIIPEGLKEVSFAVWSAEKSQDDLRWNKAEYDAASRTASCRILISDYKHLGKFHAHAYARTAAGKMIFLGSADFTAEQPSASGISASFDNSTGDFTVTIETENNALIREVQVPVWCKADQSDINWYKAQPQEDGTWVLNANIAQNKGALGKYYCHVYVRDIRGDMAFAGSDSFTASVIPGEISLGAGEAERFYPLELESLESPVPLNSVQAAVWSRTDDQDDIKWYPLQQENGSWQTVIDIANHKTAGEYYIHLYAWTAAGQSVFLGTCANLTVDPVVSGTVSAVKPAEGTVKFAVTVLPEASSPIADVSLVVKNTTTKTTVTYTGEKQADGSWAFAPYLGDFQFKSGTYVFDAFVLLENGIRMPAGTAKIKYTYTARSFLDIVKPQDGVRTIVFMPEDPAVKKVQFPVWSAEDNQDDIRWYNAQKQADGTWTYTMSLADHAGTGLFIVHCYADGAFAGAAEFTAAPDEVSEGTAKVNRYTQAILKECRNDLYQVYLWCINNIDYETMEIPLPYPPGYTRHQYYMTYAYENRKGNCFIYAAVFYWCAKALGYDCKLIEGRYYAVRSRAHNPHSWVEVYQNGTTYVCDPEIGWQGRQYDTYMVPYGSTVLTYYPNEPSF